MSKFAKWLANRRKRPYVEIVSEGGNTGEGFSLELDWNDHFINELAKNGIEGEDDEDAVRQWLQRIMRATDYDDYQEEIMRIAEDATKENNGVI